MKKIFAVMMAAATIAMVGCKKDEKGSPEIKKTTPEVAATEGYFTVVWNVVNYNDCQELVFAGNYNDYSGDLDQLVKFEAIEGYENWYVARIEDTGFGALGGKGCALNWQGQFDANWANQWFCDPQDPTHELVEIVQGDGELTGDLGENEQKLVVNEAGSVVFVRSYHFKQDPCTKPVMSDVTFTLHVENAIPEGAVVNIIGAFGGDHNWAAGELYEMTPADDGGHTFTITINCANGTEYKYALNAAVNEDAWDNEMIVVAPEEGAECLPKNKSNLKVDFTEMEDNIWGFKGIDSELAWCEDAPVGPTDPVEVHAGDVLEIKVRLAEGMVINEEGLYIWSWSHANAGATKMELTEGLWTAAITVADEADAEGWDNTGMLFVDANVAEGDPAWGRKSGQTGDIKPIAPGLYEISADWKTVTYIPANNEEEPAEEGGEEEAGE